MFKVKWSKEEDKLLIEKWPMLGEKCLHFFPNRTYYAINARAVRLNIKFINRKEIVAVNIEKIKEYLMQGKRLLEISKLIGINYHTMVLHLKRRSFKVKDYYKKYRTPKQNSRIRKFLISEISSCCQICGFDRAIDIAHIVPGRDGGPLESWNCLSLCPNHHRLFDRNELTELELFKVKNKIDSAFKYFPEWIDSKKGILDVI